MSGSKDYARLLQRIPGVSKQLEIIFANAGLICTCASEM